MNTFSYFQFKVVLCLILYNLINGINAQDCGFTINPSDITSSIFNVDYTDGSSVNKELKLSKFATGEPDIIAVSALILIPIGTSIEVVVTPGTYEFYHNGYVHPVAPNIEEGSNEELPAEEDYINNSIYNSSNPFPNKFYDFVNLGTIRGHEFGILYIYPYQYYPAKKKTYVYKNINVKIKYKGDIGQIPKNLISEFDPIETKPINYDPIKTAVINYDQVISLELKATSKLKSAKTYVEGCEFIIITNDLLLSAAERLKQYRESRGINTKIKTFTGTIIPTDIDTYVENCYKNMDPVPKYFLLLGDIDIIPASDKIYGKLTDLPYFDIEDNKKIMLPDFSSGRIPVSTLAEANTWIDKIIIYEKIPGNDPFFKNAALISFFKPVKNGCGTECRRYIKTCEELATQFKYRNINFDRLYYSNQTNIQNYTYIPTFLMHDDKLSSPIPADIELPNSYGFTWDKKSAQIISSINANKFLIVHRGHGSENAWGTDSFEQFSSSDIPSLNNSGYPSVIWSLNCLTGKFNSSTDCISEKLCKYSNGGAVGIIAATDETETIYNDYLAHGLASAIWPEFYKLRKGSAITAELSYKYLRMGDILRNGLINLVNVSNKNGSMDPGAMNHLISYHWLGDPTMEIIPFSYCQSSIDVPGDTINSGNSVLYKNYNEIFVKESFIVSNGAEAKFSAGSRIVFKPGVKFKSGCGVKVSLQECTEVKKAQTKKSTFFSAENDNKEQTDPIDMQQDRNKLVVYPNPSDGLITIECKKEIPGAIIKIYNHTGRLIVEKYLSNTSEQIELTPYGSGIYLVRLFAANTYYYKKVIVY